MKCKEYMMKNLFFLDSVNYVDYTTSFYGYAITNEGIFDETNIEGHFEKLDGTGCYVCILVHNDLIQIQQDYFGGFGLYVYQYEDYFAVSNSFWLLIEKLPTNIKLSINRDYAYNHIIEDLCSMVYEKTLINEVQSVPMGGNIEIRSGVLYIRQNKLYTRQYSVDSKEGMQRLDEWYNKWHTLVYQLHLITTNIQCDLSGGFDTRMVLSLLLGETNKKDLIDLNRFKINSANDNLSCHEEDYKIASAIANHYGFTLNNTLNLNGEINNISTALSIRNSFYLKLGFHKEMYFRHGIFKKTRFSVTGANGEAVRGYPNKGYQSYLDSFIRKCNGYLQSDKMKNAVSQLWEYGRKQILSKYSSCFTLTTEELSNIYYEETRARNHYAKAMAENLSGNTITLNPFMDPILFELKSTTDECSDLKLLMTVIMCRYAPSLLSFPIEGGRSYDDETVRYAAELCSKYPFNKSNAIIYSFPEHYFDQRTILEEEVNPTKKDLLLQEMQSMMEAASVRRSITRMYGEELYNKIMEHALNHPFHPFRHAYALLSIYFVKRCVEHHEADKPIFDIFAISE